jgi:hypothetical protein
MEAAALLALVPMFVNAISQIVAAVSADEGTPEEQKAKLDKISANLKVTMADVAAVQLPSGT